MYLQVILQVYFICSLKLLMYTTVLRVRAHYNFKDNYFNYIEVSIQLKFNYGTLSHKMKWFNWVSHFIYKNLLFFPERKIFLSPFLGDLLKIFLDTT